MVSRLQNGDVFPDLAIGVVGGGTIVLPRDLAVLCGHPVLSRVVVPVLLRATRGVFTRAGDLRWRRHHDGRLVG
jgi:hypothetical protein